MNISSNTNFEVSVDLTGHTMATTLQMPQTVLQPPPLMRRMEDSTMQVVDDDIVCIESDSEDTQSNTPLYTGTTHLATTTIDTHLPTLPQGKIITIRKNNRIFKLMIPRNVIPNMSNSPCPVSLNIPGIGPLKLKIDPFVKYNASAIPSTVNTMPPALSPFSLNFDDIHHNYENSKTESEKRKPRSGTRRKSTSTSNRKDYIKKHMPTKADKFCFVPHEGIINTLGFTISECRQPKKCLSALNSAIRKIKMALTIKTNELKRLTNASRKSSHVKTVPISKIVGPQEVIDLSDSSDNESVCNNSLLVTKKVVILNDGKEHQKTIRKRKKSTARTKQPNKKSEANIKPCYVALVRDPYVEKVYRDIASKLGNDVTKSFTEKKQHTPPKLARPPSVDIMTHLIDTETKFRNQIAYIKPITVINEQNYRTIKSYRDEFCRTNIVYALKDSLPQFMLEDEDFIIAVASGYVKLVDDELLCSYFLRELGPKVKH
ncbi:unnamed protein product [Callosobruchus maculatus]|uniref:Uncharacterized protein n=1 Tax=Callosobruchus maculatus TaxID=64391 RepID=A0A653CEK9_CALMS|nr:unnamed protein product [Callosobruchus maculatus]